MSFLSKQAVLQGIRHTETPSTAMLLTFMRDSQSPAELSAPDTSPCLYSLLAILENTTKRKVAVNIYKAICKV